MADGAPQAPLSSLGSFCWLSHLPACLTGRVPALTAGLQSAAGLLLRLQGWGWVVPTAFSPFLPMPALGFSCHGWGPRFGFLFSGGERAGPWAACPACSFTPVAMQTQPLVIPAPSPRPPAAPWPWVWGVGWGWFWPCCFSCALCLGFTSYPRG